MGVQTWHPSVPRAHLGSPPPPCPPPLPAPQGAHLPARPIRTPAPLWVPQSADHPVQIPPTPMPPYGHCPRAVSAPPLRSSKPRTKSLPHRSRSPLGCARLTAGPPPGTCLGTFRQLPHTRYWPAAEAAVALPTVPEPSRFMLAGSAALAGRAGPGGGGREAPRRSAARAAGRPHPPAAAPAPAPGRCPPRTPLRAPPIRAGRPAQRRRAPPIPEAAGRRPIGRAFAGSHLQAACERGRGKRRGQCRGGAGPAASPGSVRERGGAGAPARAFS